MNLEISLKNPVLTLYAFHLFKDTETDYRSDADQLWKAIDQLAQPFGIADLKHFSNRLTDKPNSDSAFLHLLPCTYEEYKIDELSCYVTPLKLHDTYAVDFTVFIKNKSIQLNDLSCLNPHDCLVPQNIQASIGQTLLLYAEIENNIEINEALAKECVKNLWKNDCPEFVIKKGQLFGSPLFELEEVAHHKTRRSAHILVWFGSKESQPLSLADKTNNFLIKLLCQRHKILSVAQRAQQNYETARNLYRQLEEKTKSFRELSHHGKERLRSLEKMLLEMPNETLTYLEQLRNLNDHKTTISANRENYGKSLSFFREFQLPTDNVTFWQTFYDEKSQILHQQIEINLTYLTPAQSLFQQLTNSVQGLTQIDTLKHEFDKQERIEVWVVFIATTLESAAISAKVDSHHYLANTLKKLVGHFDIFSSELGEHFIGIFSHLGIGFIFGLVALLILFTIRKFHHL